LNDEEQTLMETNANTLCQRILQQCQRQHWYAGDIDNTARFNESGRRYETYYDYEGNEIVIDNDPNDHPRKTSFAYPPATEEQLLATERLLGFPLPPLLRTLYSRLANGGFGPGHGLIGALDGFCEAGDLLDNYQSHTQRSRLIVLADYEWQGELLELPETVWHRYMLYLCDWDWGAASCIDSQTNKVYIRFPSERNLHYYLQLQNHSLEEWLEQWLRGELHYEPPQADASELDISHLRLIFEAGPVKDTDEEGD
jgi:SMI1/KNR4 family protein SUKH-1